MEFQCYSKVGKQFYCRHFKLCKITDYLETVTVKMEYFHYTKYGEISNKGAKKVNKK